MHRKEQEISRAGYELRTMKMQWEEETIMSNDMIFRLKS